VFKAGVLTAHELEGMERPPRLVVANACLSSQVSQQAGTPSDARRSTANSAARSDFSLVASLADEFFKQGVSDYIGVAWEIPSDPAKLFAEKFYQALLEPGGKIGPALLRARKALHERKAFGTAWAAYQHYGDPMRSVSSGSG
jgi:CHAT domain-containing protein